MDNFPNLKVLAMENLDVHAFSEKKRILKIKESLIRRKYLRNPIIAANFGKKYMILDGEGRYNAFKELGLKHIVAQIVDYDDPMLKVETWDHLIKGLSFKEFIEKINKIKGITIEKSSSELIDLIKETSLFCHILFKETSYLIMLPPDYKEVMNILNKIIRIYETKEIIRIPHRKLKDYIAHFSYSIIFCPPKFTKLDIREMFLEGLKFPPGVTRHIIPNRLLRLNYDIELLSKGSIDEKNTKLKEFIKMRIEKGYLRYYEEPVFIFE